MSQNHWKYNATEQCWETEFDDYIEFRKISTEGALCPICKGLTENKSNNIWSVTIGGVATKTHECGTELKLIKGLVK